jgi:hypothetical protein
VLPPETERVWNFLKAQSALEGFILIGGTAIALQIGHRRSDDLDLVYPEARLPRNRLEALRLVASESSFDFSAQDDELAVQEFADSTLDLHDYQQDYVVNGSVKVSFFTPDSATLKILHKQHAPGPRVATLPELFKTKCLVSAVRSKTRDWLDLYLLLHNHGFSLRDFAAVFREADVESQCSIALSRLCSGQPQRDDEGYSHLLPNPPSLEQMRDFFIAQRNILEVEAAADAAQKRKKLSP